MTFVAEPKGRTPIVTNVARCVISVGVVDAWCVSDEGAQIAVVFAGEGFGDTGETYARRITELLNRHGMADVPDSVPGV